MGLARLAECISGQNFSLLIALVLTGCIGTDYAVIYAGESSGQGWARDRQLNWYHANQGSRLIPKAWLVALEDASSSEPFFTIPRMVSFGYISPDADDKVGMDLGLPIGFAVDHSDDSNLLRSRLRWAAGQSNSEPWIGMTCAACHTGEVITPQGQHIRIDGGPGMGDFQSFIEALDASVVATLADNAKFDRFAAKVLGPAIDRDKGMLRTALTAFNDWERKIDGLNNPEAPRKQALRYGYGRLDAFGHIFNKVSALTGAGDQFSAPADAPVSYPFLWNVAQHDKVQWNGIAPNKRVGFGNHYVDVGALGRNTGEVIGVFADVVVAKDYSGLSGYVSTVDVQNLDAIELQLGKLLPPKWPAAFEQPKPEMVTAGRKLFVQHCQECHADLDRTQLDKRFNVVMTPIWGKRGVGTDPWMACNAFTYRAQTGNLENVPIGFIGGKQRFGPIADDSQMLTATVIGVIAGKKRELAKAAAKALIGLPRPVKGTGLAEPEFAQKPAAEREQICRDNASNALMAYKGRPLTGIWATAPYLHNGSVRTLFELLKAPVNREPSFVVGSRVFDPEKVGFVSAPSGVPFTFVARDAVTKKPIPSNSNDGHDYGNAGFTDQQRYELIAYMKTL